MAAILNPWVKEGSTEWPDSWAVPVAPSRSRAAASTQALQAQTWGFIQGPGGFWVSQDAADKGLTL